MTKKSIGQALVTAGIFSVGITVAGLTFTGDAGLKNIENNLNNMKTEFTQVVSDNTFLRTQYEKLEGFYDSSVTKANDTIAGLTSQRDKYFTELKTLQHELANQPTAEDAREEIQAEITRLEGELTKANTKIAELEATAQAIDDETQVERVIQKDYTAKEIEVATPPLSITPEAMALDAEFATTLAKDIESIPLDGSEAHEVAGMVYQSVDVRNGKIALRVHLDKKSTKYASIIGSISGPLTKYMKSKNLTSISILFSDGTSGRMERDANNVRLIYK